MVRVGRYGSAPEPLPLPDVGSGLVPVEPISLGLLLLFFAVSFWASAVVMSGLMTLAGQPNGRTLVWAAVLALLLVEILAVLGLRRLVSRGDVFRELRERLSRSTWTDYALWTGVFLLVLLPGGRQARPWGAWLDGQRGEVTALALVGSGLLFLLCLLVMLSVPAAMLVWARGSQRAPAYGGVSESSVAATRTTGCARSACTFTRRGREHECSA